MRIREHCNEVTADFEFAGAAETNDADTWNADHGVVYHLKEAPLRVEDNPAIEDADRITIEAWVNTLRWPGRAVVCRKGGSYILYNYSGGFPGISSGPTAGCSTTSRARSGTGPGLHRRHL